MELLEDDAPRFLKVEKTKLDTELKETPRMAVAGLRSGAGYVRDWRLRAAPSR
jgi:hypothetical protein